MRPIGVPLRRRSRTSKQTCHPAAPIEMKRRSMLVHSVRRVPPPKASSSHRGEFHRGSNRSQARIGFKGSPLAQMRRVSKRLPDSFRRVAQFSDENERPPLSVLSYLRPAGRTRSVLLATGHLLLVFLFVGVD